MDTEPEHDTRGVLDRLREVALWIRDSSLGVAGFVIVTGVAIAGWTVSFIGLHTFAVQHMGLSVHAAWLVPATFDGAPAGLTLVAMRAASHGRSGMVWRLLIVAFTLLSCWINYEHITDPRGRVVAALMPLAAVVVFEGLVSEAREADDRRKGIESRPRLHPLRWVFDFRGTLAIVRSYVLGLPLPEGLVASQKRTATRTAASTRQAAATATSAAPGTPASPAPASAASPASASPPQTLPAPTTAASATPASPPATGTASAPTGSQPKAITAATDTPAGSSEARDLDEVAAVYRALAKTLGRTPSDAKLAEALGVGRSRAQQLRTAAIEAGHTDLAKGLQAAS